MVDGISLALGVGLDTEREREMEMEEHIEPLAEGHSLYITVQLRTAPPRGISVTFPNRPKKDQTLPLLLSLSKIELLS